MPKAKQSKVPVAAMTIGTLADGYAGRAIDSALRRATDDIMKRDDKAKRTVAIKIEMKPTGDGRVKISVSADAKLPAYVPSETIATIDTNAGGLMFSPDCAENPDQVALPSMGHDED